LKLKARGRQEFVIAGYTRGSGGRAGTFGSLVLAVNETGELRDVGNVGTGFDDPELHRLLARLRPLELPDSPFRVTPKLPRVRPDEVTWAKPELVAEIEFAEWTHAAHLRQPSYKGLRDDKPARAVRHERPAAEIVHGRKGELRLSNLDKLV
jgi:bifunctional non-homologous end joining protein LigD